MSPAMARVLTPQPLSADAFAPFGDVLEAPTEAGQQLRPALLENRRPIAAPDLVMVRVDPSRLPVKATLMERHRFSSQAFVPVDEARFLVLVAPHAKDGGPDATRARAFIAAGGQGVNYHADVWHHPVTVLGRSARFAVFMWNDGSDTDTEFVDLAEPLTVAPPEKQNASI